MYSKANLLTLGCGEGKYSIYCMEPGKENGQLVLKRPELPNGFQTSVLKGNIRAEGCAVHGQFFDWLVVR